MQICTSLSNLAGGNNVNELQALQGKCVHCAWVTFTSINPLRQIGSSDVVVVICEMTEAEG